METFAKPRILVSRCLSFAACRWNGLSIDEPLIESLKPFADFVTTCPECEIGLGVPRHPIRLVANANGAANLMQPATGLDCTEKMQTFSKGFVEAAGILDGAILKFKSPSCGLANVKLYRSIDKGEAAGKGSGLFAAELLKQRPALPAEDEGRLKNFLIREHFLTRIFLGAELRAAIATGKMKTIVDFHTRCKYLLMAYSQTSLRKLGRLVADGARIPFQELADAYSEAFSEALAKPAKEGSAVNVLQHVMGHFSKELTTAEKSYFLDLLEDYLRGSSPMSVPLGVLKAWALRFDEKYILSQRLLRPYPEALISICDSGKGRDF